MPELVKYNVVSHTLQEDRQAPLGVCLASAPIVVGHGFTATSDPTCVNTDDRLCGVIYRAGPFPSLGLA